MYFEKVFNDFGGGKKSVRV